MCRYQTSWSPSEEYILGDCVDRLQALLDDELITSEHYQIKATEKGKQFLRNICMAFDARLWRNQPATQIFSTTA